jgi:hypothetical protein
VNAEQFNALYPVGTPVFAYPGCRPEDDANDERLVTFTRSKAEVLGGHTDVVWVDGHGACIALTHIDVRADDDAPVGITNPALAARIAATGVPLSADWAPQPATPRWHQLRTELVATVRPYMPETAATKAVDLLDEVITEALLEGERKRPTALLGFTNEEAGR